MSHIMTDEIVDISRRRGLSFGASVEVELSPGGVLKTIFVTGSRPVIFYSRLINYDGDGVNTYIYRLPNYTGGTTSIEILSSNDIIQNDAESYFLSGSTVSSDGILTRPRVPLFSNTSNQGRGALLQSIDEELEMPPNYTYCFVLESRDSVSAQNVASVVAFSECDYIPDISISGVAGEYVGRGLSV